MNVSSRLVSGVGEKTVEGGEEVGNQLLQSQFGDDFRGFGDNEVIAVRQGFTEAFHGGWGGGVSAQVFEGCKLLVEFLLGHLFIFVDSGAIPRAPILTFSLGL